MGGGGTGARDGGDEGAGGVEEEGRQSFWGTERAGRLAVASAPTPIFTSPLPSGKIQPYPGSTWPSGVLVPSTCPIHPDHNMVPSPITGIQQKLRMVELFSQLQLVTKKISQPRMKLMNRQGC